MSHQPLRDELYLNLNNEASINSIAIENNIVDPLFLNNHHQPEQMRYWERHLKDYHSLMVEVESLKKVYDDICQSTQNNNTMDADQFVDYHKQIFRRSRYAQAGKFRQNNSIDQINAHPLPRHNMIPEQLQQHFEWLNERMQQHQTINTRNFFEIFHIAAEIHFRLLISMPFEIGNGILARLVSDSILISRNIFHPVAAFNNRDNYFEAIKNISVDHYQKLAEYFLKNHGMMLQRMESFITLLSSQYDNNSQIDQSASINTESDTFTTFERL